MLFRSYSQCEEDKILFEKYFSKYAPPTDQCYYFEMGAMDGITYSNTRFFEETLGWTGILVEPNPMMYHNLLLNRPNNVVMNVICSDQTEPVVFNICANVPAVCSLQMTKPSDFDGKYYDHSEMLQIKTIPVSLDAILEKSGVPRIDLCVIDVEGHEVNVLNSFSFKVPVVMFMIEFLEDQDKNYKVVEIMAKHNYTYMGKCQHNAIFIGEEYLKCFNLQD
jgi:FkbM family methyltransferase